MNKFQIITLFPDYFTSPLKEGLLGRAFKEGLMEVSFSNPRQFTRDGRVDDYPFGGGDSMILSYTPLKQSLESFTKKGYVVYPSPQGRPWSARKARIFAQHPLITFICGRYGGVDERFIRDCVDEEISLGDYILNGGEAAVLTLLESLSRFIPGVLGNEKSAEEESFEGLGLLEGPQWTRPQSIEGHQIPKVLFSGHHEKIKDFRFFASLVLTALKRPELIKDPSLQQRLSKAQRELRTLSSEELRALGLRPVDLERADFFTNRL